MPTKPIRMPRSPGRTRIRVAKIITPRASSLFSFISDGSRKRRGGTFCNLLTSLRVSADRSYAFALPPPDPLARSPRSCAAQTIGPAIQRHLAPVAAVLVRQCQLEETSRAQDRKGHCIQHSHSLIATKADRRHSFLGISLL